MFAGRMPALPVGFACLAPFCGYESAGISVYQRLTKILSSTSKASDLNWRGLLLPVGAVLAWWALLIHQLGAQWSVYVQYRYGWAVPLLCAYLLWQRVRRGSPLRLERFPRLRERERVVEDRVRDTGRSHPHVGEGQGEVSNSGQHTSCSSGIISGSSLPTSQSGVEPPHSKAAAGGSHHSRVPWLALSLMVFCALLYAPTRWLHEANPIWRLTSWLWALEVIAITLLALRISVSTFQRFSVSTSAFVFPLCFFLVAVPWPSVAENFLVQALTGLNVTTTIELLNLFGIPAIQHGNIIEISTGVVGVNEACSGIRSFQATLMLSLFFGELYSLSVKRRIALCLLGFASSFGFNVARTFLLTYVASKQGVPALDQWHDPAGITVLVWCFVAIWLASLVMQPADEAQRARRKRQGAKGEPGSAAVPAASSSGVPPHDASRGVTPLPPPSALNPQQFADSATPPSASQPSTLNPQPSTLNAQPSTLNPQPSTILACSFGLLAWLVLVEAGVQLWYRSHEQAGRRGADWALRVDDLDSSFKKVETPPDVLSQFNADENAELRWQEEGAHWQLYYFRWRPASSLKKRVAVQLSKTHGPEKCLPAAGMTMQAYLGIKQVEVHGLTMALQHYVFGDPTRPVHVFYAIYEDPTGTETLANRRRDVASRVAAALAGSRNYGQRFLELAVWGIFNEQDAEAAVQQQLEKIVRVQR